MRQPTYPARTFGYGRTRSALPEALQQRVIGATWHSRFDLTEWQLISRYEQIRRYLGHRRESWLAVDDDAEGWEARDGTRLVQCDGNTGLGDPVVLDRLRELLT